MTILKAIKNYQLKIKNCGLFLTFIFHFSFFIFHCLYSAIFTYTNGTTSGQFLNIPVAARASSLAEAYTGYAKDAGIIEYNPAGVGNIYNNEIYLSYLAYFEQTSVQSLTFVKPLKKYVVGLNGKYLNSKDTERDIYGNDKGSFDIIDWSVLLSGAYKITNEFSVGLGVRNIAEKLNDKSADGFAVNIGIFIAQPKQRISLGAAVVNIGNNIKFDKENDPLTLTLKLGGSWGFSHRATLLVEVIQPNDSGLKQRLAVEYHLTEPLWLRFGWKINQRKFADYTGFTSGFGLRINRFYLDYAFVPHSDLGVSHYITTGLRFGKSLPLPKHKIKPEIPEEEEKEAKEQPQEEKLPKELIDADKKPETE
ncbi:MAG: PorV/PorQ family protein [Elusimicrobiota bacterium]